MKLTDSQLRLVSWGLSFVVVLLAFIAWGQGNGWQIIGISTYQLFPLLGLIAFSVMWSHYIAGALRLSSGLDRGVLKAYFSATSYIVLIAILLHPGLLAWQLWRDGQGLPPGSELNYVGPALKTAIIGGMIALMIFLAYELHRWFVRKSWWKYIQYLSDIAMFMIFFHSLRLGSQLQRGWFQKVWYFYGISLVLSLVYSYSQRYIRHKQETLVKS